jgi:hypothetical protein
VLRRCALADTTSTKYSAHWDQWNKFCGLMSWSPWLVGPAEDCDAKLGIFATFCWCHGWNGRGNQYDTIRLKLSSIQWHHRSHLGVSLDSSPSLDILMQGIRKMSDPVRKKQPLTPAWKACCSTISILRGHAAAFFGGPS